MKLLRQLLGKAGSLKPEQLRKYAAFLIDHETVICGFHVMRDQMIFTSHRILFINVQGMTGKKVEVLSIPYTKITKFSVETAGSLDLDSDLKIWIGSESAPYERKLAKDVDVIALNKALSTLILT